MSLNGTTVRSGPASLRSLLLCLSLRLKNHFDIVYLSYLYEGKINIQRDDIRCTSACCWLLLVCVGCLAETCNIFNYYSYTPTYTNTHLKVLRKHDDDTHKPGKMLNFVVIIQNMCCLVGGAMSTTKSFSLERCITKTLRQLRRNIKLFRVDSICLEGVAEGKTEVRHVLVELQLI